MATRKTTTNKKDETANEIKETAKKTSTRKTAAKKDEAKEEVKETVKKTSARKTAAKKDEAAETKEEVKETAKKTSARKTAAKKDEAAETKEEIKENAKRTSARKTAAKKDGEAAETKEEVKETAKKTSARKTAAKKDEETAETKEEPKEINKKSVSLKTSLSEENYEIKETNKKVSISSIANRDKETNTKAIELQEKKENKIETKPSESLSFLKRDDGVKKEEKKDLKELIKEATAERKNSDRSIVLKTSSPVRKLESIKTENIGNKTERESITLLKEAIKAKSKNVSRPVSVKKRIAIVDDDTNDTSVEKNNESSSELSTSKPIINSVFAAHNIKDNNENLLNKTEQPEDTETKEISQPESTASVTEHNNYKSSSYSFNKFETKEEIKNSDEVTETSEIEEKSEEKIEIIEESEKKSEEITEDTAVSSDSEEKTEEVKETSSNETFESKIDINEKATYSKSDIFKRPVIIPPNDEDVIKSKYNQEEMDQAIKTAHTIDENEEIEKTLNEKIQELKDKDIKIIETEDELKSSSLPEIEKKPAEPYVAPPHSIDGNKKSNKIIAIVGIIIIIFGLSFLGIRFFSGKSNEIDDGFYDIVTNETITDNNLQSNSAVNTQTNIQRPQTNTAVNVQTNAVKPQTNTVKPQTNAVKPQTNTVKPQTNAVKPQTNTVKPQTNAVKPQTNTVRPQTNTQQRPQTNTVKPQTNTAVNTQTNTVRPQTNTAVNTQTNTVRPQTNTQQRPQTNTAPTPPKEPEITPPTPPTPPPNPPAANTNAGANMQNNTGTTVSYNSDTYKTKWTDTLTSIAISELGDGRRWPSIFVLNEEIMNNPDSIVFNRDIKIPKGGKKKVEDMNDTEKRQLYNDYIKVSQIYQKIGKQSLANAIKTQANAIIK